MQWYTFSCILLLCIHTAQPSPESTVKDIIKKIHDAIPEPIQIPKANFSIPENKFISGFFNLSNLVATGLKAFDLNVKFILFGLIPDVFTFHLENLELDTDYLLNIPLFNLKFLTIFGMGKFHLSLTNLSMNGSIAVNFNRPLKNLKINLDDAQLNITGFLNDPDFNEELSKDMTKGIPLTINRPDFATVVEKVLNGVVAMLFNKNKTDETVSSEEMNNGLTNSESLSIVDLLDTFRMWVEDFFKDYRTAPEIKNSFL